MSPLTGEPRAIFVVGPTASGKSILALELARRLDGEIISMDSMQIYQGLAVLTNQPSAEELAVCSHHLLAVADPRERWDAMRWARRAQACVDEILGRGRWPILCGGTGLYMRCLVEGLDPLPPGDEALRELIREEAAGRGETFLHERLSQVDPESAARISPGDRHRIVRALEVHRLTGRAQSEFFGTGARPSLTRWLALGLDPERERLYGRIDERVDEMWASGAVEEVRALLGLGGCRTVMQAIGVSPISRWLAGETSETEARERMKRDSRRYAKRQMTWFRKVPEIRWHRGGIDEASIRSFAETFIASFAEASIASFAEARSDE